MESCLREPEEAKLAKSAPLVKPPPVKHPEHNDGRTAATATKEGMAFHMHQPKATPRTATKETEAEAANEDAKGEKASEEAATAAATPSTLASSSEVGNVYEF